MRGREGRAASPPYYQVTGVRWEQFLGVTVKGERLAEFRSEDDFEGRCMNMKEVEEGWGKEAWARREIGASIILSCRGVRRSRRSEGGYGPTLKELID